MVEVHQTATTKKNSQLPKKQMIWLFHQWILQQPKLIKEQIEEKIEENLDLTYKMIQID